MLIKFNCSHCQTALQIESEFAGKSGICPKCKKKIMIPEKDTKTQREQKKTMKKE